MHNAVKLSLVRHSLFWWVAGNIIRVLLALLVMFSSLNAYLAPVTYGRLVPLHLNFHLYGWSAFPMIALLYLLYLPNSKLSIAGIWFWSFSLAVGGLSWLLGGSSGKLFLEWRAESKNIFIANLAFLWLVLAIGFLKEKAKVDLLYLIKILFLFALGVIPFVFNFALRPDVFPPINTASSGATGASLLISSLGVVAIFLLAPVVLKIKAQVKYAHYFIYLFIHLLFWLSLSHGHSSHHQASQIIGLSSMLVWIPLLFMYYRKFQWPNFLWLKSFAFWGALLVIDATITFLPGVLEFAKFTNLLVAHVHIAMAGMTTSFAMIVLSTLLSDHHILNRRIDYNLWNYGLLLHLLSLFVIGLNESEHFYYLFSESSDFMFFLRLLSGVLMSVASINMFYRGLYEI